MGFFVVRRPRLAPLTTSQIIPKGTVPSLPSGGSVATDPTWGCQIMRVTDSTDAVDAYRLGTIYSDLQSLNSDNTKVVANFDSSGVNSGAYLYAIDPSNFTRGSRYSFPSGLNAGLGGWSRSNPNYYFCPAGSGTAVKRIDWSTPASPVVTTWDFNGVGGLGATDRFALVFNFADDEDTFATEIRNPSTGDSKGYAVVRLSTTSVLLKINNTNMDNANITRDGLYLFARYSDRTASGGIAARWVRISDGTDVATLTGLSPDYYAGHYDVTAGNGVVAGNINTGEMQYRTLATAHSPVTLVANSAFQEVHVSSGGSDVLDATGKRNVLIGFENVGGSGASDVNNSLLTGGEFVEVPIDGSGTWRRWGRHYSVVGGTHPSGNAYWTSPRANWSSDHRFICFSSNMGQDGAATDLYILKLS